MSDISEPKEKMARLEFDSLKQQLSASQITEIIRDQYVIISGADENGELSIYYHVTRHKSKGGYEHNFGITPYPRMRVNEANIHFNSLEVLLLKHYLIKLPFGKHLVHNVIHNCVSLRRFELTVNKYYQHNN